MAKIQSNYYNVETKAYNFLKSIDSNKHWPRMESLLHYDSFLRERVKCPTRADIAMKDVATANSHFFQNEFKAGERICRLNGEVLIASLLEKVEEMYPKTIDIREQLITMERVNHKKINPVLKGFDKLKLKLKLFM